MQTEYNRTEVQERAGNLKDALQKLRFDLNQKGSLRLLESLAGSTIRP
jgi:hypothetical protein